MLDKILGIKDVISEGLKTVGNVIDNIHTSEEEKEEARRKLIELENSLTFKVIDTYQKEIEAQKETIVAEASSENFLASSWRPITALTFTYIIAHNYIIGPIIEAIWGVSIVLPIPPDMWQLLKLMITGYVVSRGVEKSIGKINLNKTQN